MVLPACLSSVALPPVMTCRATRPPESWSMVASWRAISVGAVKPGRCAIKTLSRSVTPSTCWPDLKPVRRGGVKRQQRSIESGCFVGFRYGLDVMTIEHGTGPHDGFGRIVVGDVSDEFH